MGVQWLPTTPECLCGAVLMGIAPVLTTFGSFVLNNGTEELEQLQVTMLMANHNRP